MNEGSGTAIILRRITTFFFYLAKNEYISKYLMIPLK